MLLVGIHLLQGAAQAALFFPLIALPAQRRLKRRWSRRLLARLGVRLAADEAALARCASGLLVCNHVSFIDIFVINAVLPSGFVAKADVAGWPLIGWLCRRSETVFLARGNRRAAHQTQQRMVEQLLGGARLAIFPEGTTTAGDRVLPFHGALFQAAIDAAVPVHCLALRYQDRHGEHCLAPAYVGNTSLLDCLRGVLGEAGIEARLTLCATHPPPLPDRRHLAHQAHTDVTRGLRQLGQPTAHRPDAPTTGLGAMQPRCNAEATRP